MKIRIPDLGRDEVEVTDVSVRIGDSIRKEQTVLTVEGSKASLDVPSPHNGTVVKVLVDVGDTVRTGTPVVVLNSGDPNVDQSRLDQTTQSCARPDAPTPSIPDAHAGPRARRVARQLDVDLRRVRGTGRKGRVLCEDVRRFSEEIRSTPEVDSRVDAAGANVRTVELSKIQKISGLRLSQSWSVVPHVTHFDEADVTDAEEFRKQSNADPHDRRAFTLLSVVLKVVAAALRKFPRFNSVLSSDGATLSLHSDVNVGIAVDTPRGLLVPVCRNVERKGLVELSRELRIVADKARQGRIAPSDMRGGGFTVSNLGSIGGQGFTPIVNAPEVAILGVARVCTKPVWRASAFVPRSMLPLSLSYDHRVVDGADGARFVNLMVRALSDVRRLVL